MTSRSQRHRVVLGVHVSVQSVVIVLVSLVLALAVGLAILSWLEGSA